VSLFYILMTISFVPCLRGIACRSRPFIFHTLTVLWLTFYTPGRLDC
jgi:hypothetical protein